MADKKNFTTDFEVICIRNNGCALTKDKKYKITDISRVDDIILFGTIDDFGKYSQFNADRFIKCLDSIALTHAECVELMYLYENGFNYLAKNEIGSTEVFMKKPHRNYGTGYATWVERGYPMTTEEMGCRKLTFLGEYKFILWDNEPIKISDLISQYEIRTMKGDTESDSSV